MRVLIQIIGCFMLTCLIASAQSDPIDSDLLERANKGDAKAEVQIGRIYQRGKVVPRDNELAAQWYRKAAQHGSSDGQYRLGIMLMYGDGGPKDVIGGLQLLTKASASGSLAADVMLGQIYEDGGLLRPASNEAYQIVDMVPKNNGLALKFYRLAANKGIAVAENHLGLMYLNGKGVIQNYAEAYFWLSVGAAGGIHSTTDNIDDLDTAANHLSSAVLSKIQTRATNWFEQHPPTNPFE